VRRVLALVGDPFLTCAPGSAAPARPPSTGPWCVRPHKADGGRRGVDGAAHGHDFVFVAGLATTRPFGGGFVTAHALSRALLHAAPRQVPSGTVTRCTRGPVVTRGSRAPPRGHASLTRGHAPVTCGHAPSRAAHARSVTRHSREVRHATGHAVTRHTRVAPKWGVTKHPRRQCYIDGTSERGIPARRNWRQKGTSA
jgi:hypothetical protein